MIRLFQKGKSLHPWNYIYLKSTPWELLNVLIDAESELCQKLLNGDSFPGAPLTGNIMETINATTWKKYFFEPAFKG